MQEGAIERSYQMLGVPGSPASLEERLAGKCKKTGQQGVWYGPGEEGVMGAGVSPTPRVGVQVRWSPGLHKSD